jgi:hypothetical protein
VLLDPACTIRNLSSYASISVLQLKHVPEHDPISTKKALELRGSSSQSEERAEKHDHAAMLYNHVSVYS